MTAVQSHGLDGYLKHLERYGPELVLETGARDLDPSDLSTLVASVEHRARVARWRDGRWHERKDNRPRSCEGCGLDLPAGSRSNRRFHGSTCRVRGHRSSRT